MCVIAFFLFVRILLQNASDLGAIADQMFGMKTFCYPCDVVWGKPQPKDETEKGRILLAIFASIQ